MATSQKLPKETEEKLVLISIFLKLTSDRELNIKSIAYSDSVYSFEVRNSYISSTYTKKEDGLTIVIVEFDLVDLNTKEVIASIGRFEFPIEDLVKIHFIRQKTKPPIYIGEITLKNNKMITFAINNLEKYKNKIKKAVETYPNIIFLDL
jgi:hypothetical protein